jgi:hypothetical protein
MKKTNYFPADELWVTLIPRGNGDESAFSTHQVDHFHVFYGVQMDNISYMRIGKN